MFCLSISVMQQVLMKGLLLIYCLFPVFLKANMPPDSLSVQYPIDDPRNPECPCHQYQKLADDEYKRLLVSTEGMNIKTGNEAASREFAEYSKHNTVLSNKIKTKRIRYRSFLKNQLWHFSGAGRTKSHRGLIRRFKSIDDCFWF